MSRMKPVANPTRAHDASGGERCSGSAWVSAPGGVAVLVLVVAYLVLR
jgi:hypothetical protein